MPARERDEVAEHGRRGGVAAGARAGEGDGPHGVRHDLDPVEDPVGSPQGTVAVDHARQDGRCRATVGADLGEGDQLERQAQHARGGDLVGGHPRDAGAPRTAQGRRRGEDIGGSEPGTECEAGQDHDLVDGIVTFDVATRIGLGVAASLRLGEHVGVRAAILAHRSQDEVRGPVHDAADLVDLVGREVGRQRRKDGRAAADRRFEPEGAAVVAGDPLEFRAVVRDDVLIRGDNALAGGERRGDQGAGRLIAAHQLHDHVHVRVRDEVRGRVGHDRRRDAARDHAVHELVGNAREDQLGAVERRQPVCALQKGTNDRSADGARTEHRDTEGGHAGHRGRS